MPFSVIISPIHISRVPAVKQMAINKYIKKLLCATAPVRPRAMAIPMA